MSFHGDEVNATNDERKRLLSVQEVSDSEVVIVQSHERKGFGICPSIWTCHFFVRFILLYWV